MRTCLCYCLICRTWYFSSHLPRSQTVLNLQAENHWPNPPFFSLPVLILCCWQYNEWIAMEEKIRSNFVGLLCKRFAKSHSLHSRSLHTVTICCQMSAMTESGHIFLPYNEFERNEVKKVLLSLIMKTIVPVKYFYCKKSDSFCTHFFMCFLWHFYEIWNKQTSTSFGSTSVITVYSTLHTDALKPTPLYILILAGLSIRPLL